MILEKIAEINGSINGVVWGIFGLALLIGTGIIVTCCTKFFQVSHLALWWKNTIGSLFTKDVLKHRKEKGVISPFQALCTALHRRRRRRFLDVGCGILRYDDELRRKCSRYLLQT